MGHPQPVFFSPEDYLVWEARQTCRHEYENGRVRAMTGAREAHVTVAGNLFAFLREHLRGTPCRTFISDMKLRVEVANAFYYPDVFVTCDPRDRETDRFKRHPVLVAEVLSESTAKADYGRKFDAYRRLDSLREYALLDPDTWRADLFRREAGDRWVRHAFTAGALGLECLSLVVPFERLFEDVPPPEAETEPV